MWSHNIWVVIIPSIPTFAFIRPSTDIFTTHLNDFNLLPLALWIIDSIPLTYFVQGKVVVGLWENIMALTGLTLSMVVNALVTSLIIFRILKMFRAVRSTSNEQILGATHRSALQPVIFMLIESGMLLFSIQLIRLVFGTLLTRSLDSSATKAYPTIAVIHQMFTVSTSHFYLYFSDNDE